MQLALVFAGFNLATAATQFFGWRRLVKARVDFSFLLFHRQSAIQLAKYGSVMSIWTLAMFFVSGLDIVIVGHYQYKDTGFYAIANGASNFMLALVSSVFGPLVPAVSSMQSGTTPGRIGDICVRMTRYCALLLCFSGCPWCSAVILCSAYGWESGMPHKALFISRCWFWAMWFDSLFYPTFSLSWPREGSIWPQLLRSRKRASILS